MNDADERKLQVIKDHLWECPKPMTCRGLCDECCKRWMVEKIETLDRYFEEACALGASSVNRAEHAERQLEDLRLTEEEKEFVERAVSYTDFEIIPGKAYTPDDITRAELLKIILRITGKDNERSPL